MISSSWIVVSYLVTGRVVDSNSSTSSNREFWGHVSAEGWAYSGQSPTGTGIASIWNSTRTVWTLRTDPRQVGSPGFSSCCHICHYVHNQLVETLAAGQRIMRKIECVIVGLDATDRDFVIKLVYCRIWKRLTKWIGIISTETDKKTYPISSKSNTSHRRTFRRYLQRKKENLLLKIWFVLNFDFWIK